MGKNKTRFQPAIKKKEKPAGNNISHVGWAAGHNGSPQRVSQRSLCVPWGEGKGMVIYTQVPVGL